MGNWNKNSKFTRNGERVGTKDFVEGHYRKFVIEIVSNQPHGKTATKISEITQHGESGNKEFFEEDYDNWEKRDSIVTMGNLG